MSSWTRSLGLVATSSSELDVKGSDAFGLALLSNMLSGKHGSVRRSFISIGFDFHTTGHSDDGFSAGEISHVHEGIVERSEDMGNTEHILTLRDTGDLGHEDGSLLLGGFFSGGFDFLFFRLQKRRERRREGKEVER